MTTVYSSFTTPEAAEKAMGALLDHGVKTENISVLFNESYRGAVGPVYKRENEEHVKGMAETGLTTTTAADAGAGAITGAGVGLAVGILAGLASILIPGVGLVIGGGAAAAALGGAAAATGAGAIAGGVTGYLKDQGMPAEATDHYGSYVSMGGAVVTVNVDGTGPSEVDIRSLLTKYGAADARGYPQPSDRDVTAGAWR